MSAVTKGYHIAFCSHYRDVTYYFKSLHKELIFISKCSNLDHRWNNLSKGLWLWLCNMLINLAKVAVDAYCTVASILCCSIMNLSEFVSWHICSFIIVGFDACEESPNRRSWWLSQRKVRTLGMCQTLLHRHSKPAQPRRHSLWKYLCYVVTV